MNLQSLLLLALLGASFLLLPSLAAFVTMRQDSNRNGYFNTIDSSSGAILQSATNATSIVFRWPYCEMTSDQQGKRVFAVIFPDNSNNSVLYQLNKELNAEHIYPNTDFWFFDLQYSPKQDTLYGIKVTSTYGRVLSNFALPKDDSLPLIATELITMPYMWYVNASSFDDDNNRYFALLNYFPGHPESTLNQKLVVATMLGTSTPSESAIFDINSSTSPYGILLFITYSKLTNHLYFANVTKEFNKITLGVLCPKTGEVKFVIAQLNAFTVGPLAVDDATSNLTFFVKLTGNGEWTLYRLPISSDSNAMVAPVPVEAYNRENYSVFDAVARF